MLPLMVRREHDDCQLIYFKGNFYRPVEPSALEKQMGIDRTDLNDGTWRANCVDPKTKQKSDEESGFNILKKKRRGSA